MDQIEILNLFTYRGCDEDLAPFISKPFNIYNFTYATDRIAIVRLPHVPNIRKLDRAPLSKSVHRIFNRRRFAEQKIELKEIDLDEAWQPDFPVPVGSQYVNLTQVERLKQLPGCVLYNSYDDREEYLRFVFEGGEGRVMPMTLNYARDFHGMRKGVVAA